MPSSFDYVIVGAGIVGLAIARELKARRPKSSILILEKESGLGRHASGRNSGVLHSGIFYAEDSVKAKVCAQGAREMAAYCEDKKLPIRKTGKVIVPAQAGDEKRLEALYERGRRNGIPVRILNSQDLAALEPDVESPFGKALHLPEVCVIDPAAILRRLAEDLEKLGVVIRCGCPFKRVEREGTCLTAGGENFFFGYLFNAAGLQADRVAKTFGVGENCTILPFKGFYYKLSADSPHKIHGLIYAVPDPRVPFLGIHFARSVYDEVTLGPTVVPAFGRENYRGFEGMNPLESFHIAAELLKLYRNNKQGFRTFARREALRFLKPKFYEAARRLVPRLKIRELLPSGKVGIRAQLVDLKKEELVMDFLVENGKNSTHILNAVSPAFTSSFTFARLVLDQAGIR